MEPHYPAPPGGDTTTPNVARMYDYYLGGKNNFAVDRAAADRILAMAPEVPHVVRANREFLAQTVKMLVERGIRQFIDIGSGLPTKGNVHEIAQRADPEARVVYVDYDPAVCAHGRALLEQSGGVVVAQADLREPEEILGSPDVRSLINLDEPVAVLMVAMLHFVRDGDDPAGIIAKFRDAIAPGSYLVVTHASADAVAGREQAALTVTEIYSRASAALVLRDRDEIIRLFEGFDLLEPGVAWLAEWNVTLPAGSPEDSLGYAAIGRKP